jgi:hypothetical protein
MAWTQMLSFAIGLGGAPDSDVEGVAPELALGWDAPDGCPDEAEVAARVEELLGRTLDASSRDPVVAQGVIRREGEQRFELTLWFRTATGAGTKTFEGQTCDVLADAAALVLTAAVGDPASAPEVVDPKPEPPEDRSVTKTAPTKVAEPTDEDEPRSVVAGAVRAGAAGLLGPLPGPTLGVEAAAALLVRRARVELRFAYWFPRRAEADGGGRGAEIQLWTLGLRGCWAPGVKIVEFPLCGGVQAGPMRGDGFGLGAPTSTRLAWVAFDAGAAIAVVPWPFLGFWLGADLIMPATRPGFEIDDLGLVHRAAPVGGQAALGIEGRFGRR